MKIRRGLIVMALVGGLVVGTAQPAHAVYLLVGMVFGGLTAEEKLQLEAFLEGGYAPFKVSDGFAAAMQDEQDPVLEGCTDNRAGKAQRKVDRKWKTVDSARTNNKGKMKFQVPAKNGATYRVLVPKFMNEDTGYECFKGVSKAKTYKK